MNLCWPCKGEKMNLRMIQNRVQEIRELAEEGDNKAAHAAEDGLYEDFLRYLTGWLAGKMGHMVDVVLSTKDIPFTRHKI